MWQNLHNSQPVIDLTASVEDNSTACGSTTQRMSNRTSAQLAKYRLQSGLASLARKTAVKGKTSTISSRAVDQQAEAAPPSTYESSTVMDPGSQPNPSQAPQGHFTLCPNGRALKCNYCPFICRRTCGRMIKHLQVHGIRSRNQCKSCGLGFLNKSELQDHQKVCTQPSLAPQCTECGKTFSFRSLLRQHMNTHVTKKPFRCGKCPMAFSSVSLCKLHKDKQHPTRQLGKVNMFQCTYCFKNCKNKDDLNHHLRQHVEKESFSSMDFSTSTRDKHVSKVQRPKSTSKCSDGSWVQTCHNIASVTSSGISSIPVSIQAMTMPIVVSVSSQSMKESQNKAHDVIDVSSFTRPLSVEKPSELTAGSPERIDEVNPVNSGLVYMRRELNPDVENEDREAAGPAVLRTWSVSDCSDPMGSSETAVIQLEQEPDQAASNQLMMVKTEAEVETPAADVERTSIVSAGMSSVESVSLTHGPEGLSPLTYHQQHEPTSTAREIEDPHPIEVYPAVSYKPQGNQNPPGSHDSQQRLLDVSRVVSNLSSPDGSYGRKNAEDSANPESPCGATSTRRSLDSQDNYSGSLRCLYCEITFGDPIMHYLHMGWHVTGEPWKCNGCGQECDGKVDFFLHLYKAGHK